MRKVISTLICFNFLAIQASFASAVFSDNLADKLDKNLKVEFKEQNPIVDDFALKTLNQNLKVNEVKQKPIEDNLVKYLDKNLKVEKEQKRPIEDTLARNLTGEKVAEVKFDGDKIKISPLNYYTTRKELSEGTWIDFVLVEDFKMDKVAYKKGTKIKARVETLSQNGAYGVPADLVVGNFTLPNNFVLNGNITKKGANRTFWVYPVGYMLLPFFFAGAPVFAIRGGHAKLKPHKVYEVEI